MIPAFQKNDAFLADVAGASGRQDGLRLWWLGQSGFLVKWQGKHLLLDPYLSDSLTNKYASTDKPHVRMTELVVVPERLNFIDVVTSSHNHTDHLDGETLVPLFRVNPGLQFIVPEANREFATKRAGQPMDSAKGLDNGQSVTVAGMELHAVPAAHEAIEKDVNGRMIYLGCGEAGAVDDLPQRRHSPLRYDGGDLTALEDRRGTAPDQRAQPRAPRRRQFVGS